MDKPPSNSATSSGVRFASTTDGVNIAYDVAGEGPPLLYARAWITNLEVNREDRSIARFFGELEKHRTVITYDGRGNGLSDWDVPSPITMDHLVNDLAAVAARIDAPTFDLWATTYAGPLALRFAAEHPERVSRLILDGTFAAAHRYFDPDRMKPLLELFDGAAANPVMVFRMISLMTDPDPSIGHEERVNRLRRSIPVPILRELYPLAQTFDVEELLSMVVAPTLVMHRRRSTPVPVKAARDLAARLPDASLVVLDGSAHNLFEGDWRQPMRTALEFLGVTDIDLDQTPESIEVGDPATVVDPVGSNGESVGRTVGEGEEVVGVGVGDQLLVVLFTDIVGSMDLTVRAGDSGAQSLLRAHDRVVREALRVEAGHEVKHTGDGIMASFRSVTAAARAALSIRNGCRELTGDELGEAGLGVRVGLNAGEPVTENDDLFGTAVQVAARVCDRAEAGEILVTDVVCGLLAGKAHRLVDRGPIELKGVPEPLRIWELAG